MKFLSFIYYIIKNRPLGDYFLLCLQLQRSQSMSHSQHLKHSHSLHWHLSPGNFSGLWHFLHSDSNFLSGLAIIRYNALIYPYFNVIFRKYLDLHAGSVFPLAFNCNVPLEFNHNKRFIFVKLNSHVSSCQFG